MRITCLKCGHQIELAIATGDMQRVSCVCGHDYSYPQVVNTGTRPNERAAERSRSRAFRAAGVVKNLGGFAFGVALLGVLCFPVGLVGALIGIYVLTMLRGPLGRYSGRRAAVAAVFVGTAAFAFEGAIAFSWWNKRQREQIAAAQESGADDLRALLRAERLYRASRDTYGTFQELGFAPRGGRYTLYLGPDELLPARQDGETVTTPLPSGVTPMLSESAFSAVAVADLDRDSTLDIWIMNDRGELTHLFNDGDETSLPPPETTHPDAAPSEPQDQAVPPAPAADSAPAVEPSPP